jgi:hypothetical protein
MSSVDTDGKLCGAGTPYSVGSSRKQANHPAKFRQVVAAAESARLLAGRKTHAAVPSAATEIWDRVLY